MDSQIARIIVNLAALLLIQGITKPNNPSRRRITSQSVRRGILVRSNANRNRRPRQALCVGIRRTAPGLFAILLFTAGHSLALAEWGFVDSVDAFTDEPIQFAYYSDDDHRLQLSRHDDNSIWMYITRKKIGTFEPDTNVEYRVDQGLLRGENTIDLSNLLERLRGEPTYIWQPNTVAFRVWHGNSDEPRSDPCGFIGELLSGSILRVRYYISRVDRDTFSVDLADADESIVQGLGVESCAHQE